MLSEISQTEKDKCCMISFICRIQRTKQMNKQNRNTLIEKKMVFAGVGEGWWWW